MPDKHNEIILYQPNNSVRLDVLVDSETVWLNRQQMAVLFDRDVKTIGKHINNALKEELAEVVADFATTPTIADFATVQNKPENVIVAKFATTTKHGALVCNFDTAKFSQHNHGVKTKQDFEQMELDFAM